MVSVQARLLSEAKLRRYQRAKYRVLRGRIFSLWDAYLEGKKTTSNLLRACAALYGPVIKN